MITENQQQKATGQGFSQTATFKIAANADAFKILSDSLYSNKVAAPIRELSTNAYDAHVSNGNTDEPFLVHLPNTFEPWFSVRDYGIGLSNESVYEIFTTYFESTRNKSDQFVGGFGLGSKSPFCRVDAFTVISFFNGTKSTYSMYLSQGLPTVSLIHTEPTDERNGLEVSFPVEARDFRLFADEAKKIYSWFDVKPIITGNTIDIPNFTDSSISGKNWFCSKLIASMYPYATEIHVRVGNVAYVVSTTDFKFDLNNLKGFVLEVPIGSVSITPSRERLQFDEKTINTLTACLNDIKQEFSTKVQQEIDKCDTYYNAKVTEIDYVNQYGRLLNRATLTYKGESLNVDHIMLDSSWHVTQLSFKKGYYNNSRFKTAKEYDLKAMPFVKNPVFVHDDLPTGSKARINHNYCDNSSVENVFLIPGHVTIKDAAEKLRINKSDIILASTLDKKPRIARGPKVTKSISIDDNIETYNQYIVSTDVGYIKWKNRTIPKDKEVYYYVELNNHELIGLRLHQIAHIREFLLHKKGVDLVTLYGVRRGAKDAVSNSKKWINLSSYLPEIEALINHKDATKYYIRQFAHAQRGWGVTHKIQPEAITLAQAIDEAKNQKFNNLPEVKTLLELVSNKEWYPSLDATAKSTRIEFESKHKSDIDQYITDHNEVYRKLINKYPVLTVFNALTYDYKTYSPLIIDLLSKSL